MKFEINHLLRRQEVEHFTGLSKSTLYELMADGRFPRPVRIADRAVRWRATDIAAWQKKLPLAGPETWEEGE